MVEIQTLDALRGLIGREIAVSPWVRIDQERIRLFAQATGDHQWIHVDEDRARHESPFGTTIAHGFLTLSLLPELMRTAITLPAAAMSLNYGLNKVRFPAPLPRDSRVRARITLLDVRRPPAKLAEASRERPGAATDLLWEVSIEREGSARPVCIAESISRRYEDASR